MTVGTVIKFQYDLPTNSSEYTSRIYGFANTVSRDMDGNDDADDDDKRNSIDTSRDVDKELEVISDTDNDTLVDITFNDTRRKRSLVYSEGGAMNAIDLSDVNTELPLDEAIRRQELIDRNHLEEEEEPQRMNRWDFYKIMEHMMER